MSTMASTALRTRFAITCWSWIWSASTGGVRTLRLAAPAVSAYARTTCYRFGTEGARCGSFDYFRRSVRLDTQILCRGGHEDIGSVAHTGPHSALGNMGTPRLGGASVH